MCPTFAATFEADSSDPGDNTRYDLKVQTDDGVEATRDGYEHADR